MAQWSARRQLALCAAIEDATVAWIEMTARQRWFQSETGKHAAKLREAKTLKASATQTVRTNGLRSVATAYEADALVLQHNLKVLIATHRKIR